MKEKMEEGREEEEEDNRTFSLKEKLEALLSTRDLAISLESICLSLKEREREIEEESNIDSKKIGQQKKKQCLIAFSREAAFEEKILVEGGMLAFFLLLASFLSGLIKCFI